MKWYRNFLYRRCNPTSGQWWWVIVLVIGFAGIAAYIIAALPFCATWFNLPSLGAFGKDEFIVFSGMFHLSSKAFEYYFLAIFFAIPLAKLFYLVFLLGVNYAGGYIYLPPQVSGHPMGCWVKR